MFGDGDIERADLGNGRGGSSVGKGPWALQWGGGSDDDGDYGDVRMEEAQQGKSGLGMYQGR